MPVCQSRIWRSTWSSRPIGCGALGMRTNLDLLTFAVIRWDHIFATDASTLVLLYYLPYRVTSSGFPCWQCYIFVSWSDPRWYTRYTMTKGLPIQQWMSDPEWAEYVTIFLYAPREYWCAECGPSIPDTFGRIECVEVDSITSKKTYSSPFEWLYGSYE